MDVRITKIEEKMTKSIKIMAVLLQVMFIWFYYQATFCRDAACASFNFWPILVMMIFFTIFDLSIAKFIPRFKIIKPPILSAVAILFPVLLYILGIVLNALIGAVLPTIIVGAVLILFSAIIWLLLKRGMFSAFLTEILVLKSFFLLALGATFLIANLLFALSSYQNYKSPTLDQYITENNGQGNSFIKYNFR